MLEQTERARTDSTPKVTAVVHGGTIMAVLSAFAAERGKDYFDYRCECGGGYRCLVCWEREKESGAPAQLRMVNLRYVPQGCAESGME